MTNTSELNLIAINTITSTYIREYLKRIKHQFTLEEQLTIIYNSDLSLNRKTELYTEYLKSGIDLEDNIRKSVKRLIARNVWIEDILDGTDYTVLIYRDRNTDNLYCAKNIYKLKESNVIEEYPATLEVHNIQKPGIICYVNIDKDGEPTDYDVVNKENIEDTGLENKYVEIPNDIKVCDTIKVSNDNIQEEFIVVADSNIPDTIKENGADYFDASIVVVPKYIFTDTDKTYKEQIDEIVSKRINNLNDGLDIISSSHEHIHLTVVEKIKDMEDN